MSTGLLLLCPPALRCAGRHRTEAHRTRCHASRLAGAIKVVTARKKYDIKYPTLYSTGTTKNDEMYNCAQRAHQNTLEGLPVVNLMMLSSATVYPRAAALFGFTWVVGRFLYIRGYTEGGPEGRRIGGIVSHLGDFPLLITTFCAAWHLLRA